ncbi:holin [Salmonella enterica subsp. enterica]|uniref:Holin n=1 Tax=Salmonella enterica subsp. enterica serovar Bareilly TaxID=58096 RepID=A0A5U9SD52_SALET|nr:putative holin [Salmonella enterica]EAB6122486.1 holin [Salmonella enterica subsp. enterica serovar Braenderup]EAB8633233.1 holin [Salmonella enterica subsp. enterica]EBG2409210.1 holin [Salmonella enterica subsp. enterica serovar Newport]EBS4094408.1 holin [Salmonella enterica subsp. enterica serovar Bareilly]EBU8924444.1 holin [Salmonella enterica subsp. enterica serovar Nima]ECA2175732.1 holin [Salmonella enterica subsp. enterica serovar Kisangani]ECF1963050.1 holin [Salmonella enteric
MSEPLSGTGTAVALGGATVFGLLTNTDFGIVFGAFAGALFIVTVPKELSPWRMAAHFLVSFIVGVLGAGVLASFLSRLADYNGKPLDALCAVVMSVLSVKFLTFIHDQDISSLTGVFSRMRGGGSGHGK